MIELFDLSITFSMLFLIGVYAALISVISYTSITNCLFNCKKWKIVPAPIIVILVDAWENMLEKNKRDALLYMFITFLAIIPISLMWPLTYPIIGYLMIRYKNSQRFMDLLSSS